LRQASSGRQIEHARNADRRVEQKTGECDPGGIGAPLKQFVDENPRLCQIVDRRPDVVTHERRDDLTVDFGRWPNDRIIQCRVGIEYDTIYRLEGSSGDPRSVQDARATMERERER